MTRINSAIVPKNLTDQHLIAELRELPRIFTAVRKRIEEGKGFDDIPKEFTLGTGHMKFFYNKLNYLELRHEWLREEYKKRFKKDWQFVPVGLKTKFDVLHFATSNEYELLVDRISTRITESKQTPHYYGRKITKEEAINILKS